MSDVIYLMALIVLPFLVPVLTVAGALGTGSWFVERFEAALTLHEDKGLAQQGLLWISIISPIFYFLALGVIAWNGYSISLTGEGLNNFLKVSALPLGVLTLALPLSVLVSRLHATKQTSKQIRITQQKNNIDLFNAHRKELFGYFSQIDEVNYLGCLIAKFKVHPRVHKVFFSGLPEDGVPIPNEEAFKDIESELTSAQWLLDAVIADKNPTHTYSFYIANLCSTIYRLSQKLGLPEIYIDLAEKSTLVPVVIEKEEKELLTVGTTTDEIVAAYRYARGYYHNLCDFAGRKPIETEGEYLKYIDMGGKYKTIREEKVIENLHKTEIKKAIERVP